MNKKARTARKPKTALPSILNCESELNKTTEDELNQAFKKK